MLRKNVKSLLEQLQVCIFAEIVFGVRCTLISYLLYGLFTPFLEKNTIKTPGVIFHIRLRALWLSSWLILKKYLYASFSFSY